MELILINPVRKIGKIGDVVQVKDGYGRNFLIPQKLAIRSNEKNRQLFEKQRKSLEEKNQQLYLQAQEISYLLEGKELVFIRQAAEDGKLFGSVSNKEIATSLSELTDVTINHSQIYVKNLIKYIGLYNVEVILHAENTVTIKIAVGRTELEARSLLKISDEEETAESELDALDEPEEQEEQEEIGEQEEEGGGAAEEEGGAEEEE